MDVNTLFNIRAVVGVPPLGGSIGIVPMMRFIASECRRAYRGVEGSKDEEGNCEPEPSARCRRQHAGSVRSPNALTFRRRSREAWGAHASCVLFPASCRERQVSVPLRWEADDIGIFAFELSPPGPACGAMECGMKRRFVLPDGWGRMMRGGRVYGWLDM
jgi:hypothetical protein